jgi:hypothetical protein
MAGPLDEHMLAPQFDGLAAVVRALITELSADDTDIRARLVCLGALDHVLEHLVRLARGAAVRRTFSRSSLALSTGPSQLQ